MKKYIITYKDKTNITLYARDIIHAINIVLSNVITVGDIISVEEIQ